MTVVFTIGMVTIGLLLGLLTLLSTLIGQHLPQVVAAIDAGVREARRPQALHFAA